MVIYYLFADADNGYESNWEPRKLHSMEIQSKFKQPILVKELERVHDNFLKTKNNNSEKNIAKRKSVWSEKDLLRRYLDESLDIPFN